MVTGLELIKLSVLSISFHFVINSIARDFSLGGGGGGEEGRRGGEGEGGFYNLFWYFLRLSVFAFLSLV